VFQAPSGNTAVDYSVNTVDQLAPLLKAFRRAAGLTQADLAARLGITQQTYARLEADPQVVSLGRFLRVLAVLDVQMTLGSADASASPTGPKKIAADSTRKGRTAKTHEKVEHTAPKRRTPKLAAKPADKQRPVPIISKRERW
jgi:HTH-type transcriptional regulator/antitoxin HipB